MRKHLDTKSRLTNGFAASYYVEPRVDEAIFLSKYQGAGDFPDFLLDLTLKMFREKFGQYTFNLLLSVSTFHPKAPWSKENTAAINSTVDGLSRAVFVAQSQEGDAAWTAAAERVRKGRPVYVRPPQQGETDANTLLLQKGAVAADMEGHPLEDGS